MENKYIKLNLEIDNGPMHYMPEDWCKYEMPILTLFLISTIMPEIALQYINTPKYLGHQTEFIDIIRAGNTVTIKRMTIFNDERDSYSFTTTFDNLKSMLEEWQRLWGKQEIYFIQEDDGSITVKESIATIVDESTKKINIPGFHCDQNYKTETADSPIKIYDKKYRGEWYQARLTTIGKEYTKTFYPASWDVEKIQDAVCEAVESAKYRVKIKTFNRELATGYTKEQVHLKFIVFRKENGLKIVSSYPSEEWIENK